MHTDDIVRQSGDALEAIKGEPFLAALAENSLADAALGRWVLDDTHFLRALRRMMGRLVAGAPDEHSVDVITGAYPALRFELDRLAEKPSASASSSSAHRVRSRSASTVCSTT